MDTPLSFEWDEAKAASNAAKHRVRFDYAAAVFLDAARADFDASHAADAESRRKVVGMIEGRLFTVVYTERGAVIRLISGRRSNAKETRCYGPR